MSRIAIIDLLFYWPPGGGSFVDVKEIAQRLSKDHEVTLFVPVIKQILPFQKPSIDFLLKGTKFFHRGRIKEPLNLKIKQIEFNSFDFNSKTAPRKFTEELDIFKPDTVFFTQGWHLKPHFLETLKKYRTVMRFYTYECICPKGDGHFYKLRKQCHVDLLDGSITSYLNCLFCSSFFLASYPSPVFIHEYFFGKAYLPSFRRTFTKTIRESSSIIVYNDYLKEKLVRFNSNIHVVPSGVNTKLFGTPREYVPKKTKQILMVGRSDDFKKGFEKLFDCAKKIRLLRDDFELLVTVRDKLRKPYRADFVRNLGWVSPKNLPDIYSKSDIVVIPSQWPEPFGMVAVEAMASGKPVIASRTGGLRSIIEDGKTGFLFEPTNATELRDKILVLLDNPELAREMGQAGCKKAQTMYDWDAIYEKFYKKIFPTG